MGARFFCAGLGRDNFNSFASSLFAWASNTGCDLLSTLVLLHRCEDLQMKELCEIYGVSDKTMIKWLQPFADQIGKRQGHIYNVAQVMTIFNNLGVPGVLE